MAYKAKFRPSETLRGGQWLPLVEKTGEKPKAQITFSPADAEA